MKLENSDKDLQGIFKYSDSVTYTKGDLVIYDNCLYVCKREVTGVVPGTNPTAYGPYLGNKAAGLEDFKNYLKGDNSAEDKYLTVSALKSILSNYMGGTDINGIVVNSVSDLNELMKKDSINNGYFTVSGLKSGIPDELGPTFNGILRQYTFVSGDNEYTRIQEIFNNVNGITHYRKSVKSAGGEWSVPSEWLTNLPANLSTNAVARVVSAIKDHYSERTSELENRLKQLSGTFCYRPVRLPHDYDGTGRMLLLLDGVSYTPNYANPIPVSVGGIRAIKYDSSKKTYVKATEIDHTIEPLIMNISVQKSIVTSGGGDEQVRTRTWIVTSQVDLRNAETGVFSPVSNPGVLLQGYSEGGKIIGIIIEPSPNSGKIIDISIKHTYVE